MWVHISRANAPSCCGSPVVNARTKKSTVHVKQTLVRIAPLFISPFAAVILGYNLVSWHRYYVRASCQGARSLQYARAPFKQHHRMVAHSYHYKSKLRVQAPLLALVCSQRNMRPGLPAPPGDGPFPQAQRTQELHLCYVESTPREVQD